VLFRVFIRLVFFLFLSGEDFDEIPLLLLQRERERERACVCSRVVCSLRRDGRRRTVDVQRDGKRAFSKRFLPSGKTTRLAWRERERERERGGVFFASSSRSLLLLSPALSWNQQRRRLCASSSKFGEEEDEGRERERERNAITAPTKPSRVCG
jgi:hypothetical protein